MAEAPSGQLNPNTCKCVFCLLLKIIIANPTAPSTIAVKAQDLKNAALTILHNVPHRSDHNEQTSVMALSMIQMQGQMEEYIKTITNVQQRVELLEISMRDIHEEVTYRPDHSGYDKAKHEFENLAKRQKI
jgi:CII-binding regulator of phage lambda lysogenization HflD